MLEFELNTGKKKAAFLDNLEKSGCMMNTIIFKAPYAIYDLYLVSEQAAIEGMVHIYGKGNQKVLDSIKNDKRPFDKSLYPSIITGNPKGKQVGFYEFIGTQKIVNNETISLFGKTFDAHMSEFLHALLSPPYSMTFTKDFFSDIEGNKKEYVLNKYLDTILSVRTEKDIDRLVIYKWSDDWADFFFEEGKDWWGCYYWTVYNPVTSSIVVLGASTTD